MLGALTLAVLSFRAIRRDPRALSPVLKSRHPEVQQRPDQDSNLGPTP